MNPPPSARGVGTGAIVVRAFQEGQRVTLFGYTRMPAWDTDRLRATLRLYLLADAGLVPPEQLPDIVAAALRGGVTAVQLRAKAATTLELLELARNLLAVCQEADVPFIVNDRVDVALAAEADGAHVGPHRRRRSVAATTRGGCSDRPRSSASRSGTGQEAHLATSQGASYVSAGPMFATSTKPTPGRPRAKACCAACAPRHACRWWSSAASLRERSAALYAAGADGVCVGAAIVRAADPEARRAGVFRARRRARADCLDACDGGRWSSDWRG